MKIDRPLTSEYPEWFADEIDAVVHNDLIEGLTELMVETTQVLETLTENQWMHRYEPGKWSIKEVWQHVIDVERILCYRALRYARNDQTLLSGFNEKDYAASSNADFRKSGDLITELQAVRAATLLLFKSFTADMLLKRGTTGRSEMTVRAVGYLILGHNVHHNQTMRMRYLKFTD